MPHQLTKLGAGPCAWEGYVKGSMDNLTDICKTSPESLVGDCEEMLRQVEDGSLATDNALDLIWEASRQIEIFRSVISYYRRQVVYTYVTENGHGSMVKLAGKFGVAKQRISELTAEATQERLARVTGESIVKEATA